MVATEDAKFYKGGAAGLGGAISTEIITATSNGLFGNVPRNEQVIGEDYYACLYVKNTHASEQMDGFNFWLDFISQEFNDTVIKWAFDNAGKNGTAQTIADKYTAPTTVTWIPRGSEPSSPNVGKLLKGEYFAIWIWLHVNANAISRKDDFAGFRFSLVIPGGGSGTGGGGEGPVLDIFGIKKFFVTKTGGKEWFSTLWANGHNRTITENAFDPDDDQLGFLHPGTAVGRTMIIDGAGVASFPFNAVAGGDSHRVFIHGPWTNTEFTFYYRYRTTAPNKISLRSRSNHHGTSGLPYGYDSTNDISCGFGGYMLYVSPFSTGAFRTEVEVIHEFYSGNVDPNNLTLGAQTINTWCGYKIITRTVGNVVNVQGWRNTSITDQTAWVKGTEFNFDGTNVNIDETLCPACITACTNAGDKIAGELDKNTFWTNPGYWSWIRFEGGDDQDLQFVSVREIEGGAGTGGGGGGGNPPPTPTNWKMAFVGDEGCGSTTNAVRDLCKTYDYTVSVGDHAYAAASCWTSTFSSLKPNFNGAYGNHEYSESGGIAPYKTFFGHSLTYFSFNFQNVHVVVCDSNINMDPGSAQHNFVTADLNAASANNAIDWIFAVMHHPWFGSSSTHSYNNGSEVQAFHKLFTDHGVAFVFTGHNHNWQRTHKVAYNSGSPTNPTVIDSTPPFVNDTTGLVHVVTGTGGHDSGGGLYSLGSQPAFQGYQNRTNNGIFEIVASNNGKTLTCSFVNTNGDKFDTFQYTTT
jgi:hypothetical protein